jgi:hypothetical protein
MIDVGQHAHGVIAIGQIATGVIAVGQVATGVIAIGQIARGAIAIGMGAIGLFAWGMAAVALFRASGFVGLGGMRGFGLVLPLVPDLGTERAPPPLTTLDKLYSSRMWAGWIELDLRIIAGQPAFAHAGKPISIRVDGIPREKIARYAATRPFRTYGLVNVAGSELTCTRLMDSGQRRHTEAVWWIKTVSQVIGLVAVAVAVWLFALAPAGNALLGGSAPPP